MALHADRPRTPASRVAAATLVAAVLPAVAAQTGTGIYCWKNARGQTECADRAPEAAQSDVRELNKRGITVDTRPPPPTAEQRKAQEEEQALRTAEKERLAQQKRSDRLLLDTYNSEDEIEARRKRDVGLVESRIAAIQTNIRNANDRQADVQRRMEEYRRLQRPVPTGLQDESARIDQERIQYYNQIARDRQEIAAINSRFDATRARFRALQGAPEPAVAAPAKK